MTQESRYGSAKGTSNKSVMRTNPKRMEATWGPRVFLYTWLEFATAVLSLGFQYVLLPFFAPFLR